MSTFHTLTLEQVKIIHSEIVKATGGSDGLRDSGILESALAQPQMTFGGQELYPTLAEKAAALGFSLIQNHPFVDGNKRIGWVATKTVLRLNRFDLPTKVDEAERVVLAVAAGEMSREAWTQWVQQHIVEWKA